MISLNHNRDDIVTHENEHGCSQTYQLDEDGSETPVCASCGVLVMVNKGQGSECAQCQHEALLEAEKDYDEGNRW